MPKPLPAARRKIRCVAGLVLLLIALSPGRAPAGDSPVFLGAVGVGKAKPAIQGELRALLRAELSSADFSRVKAGERYVLSASLVRLDSVQSSDSVRATCEVSVALLRDGGLTLHALIRGRATAEEAKAHADAAQSDALRAAVHSAMVRVPKALR